MNNLKWVCPECGAQHPIDDEGYVKIQPLVSYYNKSACKLCGQIVAIHLNNVNDDKINILEKMLKDAGKDIEAPRPHYPNLGPFPNVVSVYAGPTLPENYWTCTSPATVQTSDSITISHSTDDEDKPKDDRPTWD